MLFILLPLQFIIYNLIIMSSVKIKTALISVYNKDGIDPIVTELYKRM